MEIVLAERPTPTREPRVEEPLSLSGDVADFDFERYL
jgi:hypothetical protein